MISEPALRQGHTFRNPRTLRSLPAAGDRDPAGGDRTVISGPLSQLARADQPVSPSRLPESFSRTEIDCPQQDQVWCGVAQQLPRGRAPVTPGNSDSIPLARAKELAADGIAYVEASRQDSRSGAGLRGMSRCRHAYRVD
jgi:hypothetical protein